MRRVINGMFLLGIIAGGIMAWRTDRQSAHLQAEFQRLARITGDFTVDDTSKIYVQALDTGEPRHFAWKVYMPPNSGLELTTSGMVGGYSSQMNDSGEFLVRVRFLEDKQGVLNVYTRGGGGSGRMGIGDKELADLLRKRWGEIHIEQAGAPAPRMVDPKDPVVLLRLMLPENLRATVRERLTPEREDEAGQAFFELRIGPERREPFLGSQNLEQG